MFKHRRVNLANANLGSSTTKQLILKYFTKDFFNTTAKATTFLAKFKY